ncbi:ROK family protein [Pedomonas mirosovicensis]|uniref:ROK family protein n=1 Tax=Pedomonas mirosovicensis TaxID=2908641 RepID=UPI002169CA0A|nr:ROK family protein [Pedomonas mirosovicensis]MCH8686231.1 ROK family protein [Pedomonas mirosovicensis]
MNVNEMPSDRQRLLAGIELGGTKCICVLADETGHIFQQETVPTTRPEETLSALEEILARWWKVHGFRALGIASFGPVDLMPGSPTYGYVTLTSKPHWSNTDVAQRLSRPYPVPMAFDTDVNGAALAEGRWGAAKGLADYVYVTVGTGVGCGLIVHGRPTRGLGHCEIGHMRIARAKGDAWGGCCPFHGDCVEGLASGTAIKARLESEHISTISADHPVWELVAHTLAQLSHTLVLATGPKRIIMGGGVINGQPHLLPRVAKLLEESINNYIALPDTAELICAPGLGVKAGPLGPIAMALALEEAQGRKG